MVMYLEVEYFHPCLNLLYAEAFTYIEQSEQPYIPIVINSYGGYTDCLSTLLDCIQGSSKPVMTIATGVDMSCGSGLFVSGTKGLRFIGPNTTSLIHQVSAGALGKASEIETQNKNIQYTNEKLLYNLLDNAGNHEAGYTKNLVKENFNADIYLTPQEMIEHGWADKIMSYNEVIKNADNIFDDYQKQLDEVFLGIITQPCPERRQPT